MIIAVVNLKGGVGKTISSIALATAASRDGVKVRVIDTDPQGSATTWAAEAEDAGEPLPFPVVPGNVATVSRLRDGALKKAGEADRLYVSLGFLVGLMLALIVI